MIVTKELEKSWPNCAHYIKEFLSDQNIFKEKYFAVFDAFMKTVTMQLEPAQKARARIRVKEVFTLGDGPQILITKLPPDECGVYKPGVAGLQFSARNMVHVSEECANAYERGQGWMVFEGTLLHECVHWARFMSGNGDTGGDWNTLSFQTVDNPSEAGAAFEVGQLFDLWAYGFNTCKRGADGKLIQFGPPDTLPTYKPRGASNHNP